MKKSFIKRSALYKRVKQKMQTLRPTIGDENIDLYNVKFENALEEGLKEMFKEEESGRTR